MQTHEAIGAVDQLMSQKLSVIVITGVEWHWTVAWLNAYGQWTTASTVVDFERQMNHVRRV